MARRLGPAHTARHAETPGAGTLDQVRMLAIAKYHTIRLITSGFRVESGDCYCFNNSRQNHPRSRYSGWLGEAYNRSETVVRSTDVDRTLMSAQVRQLCKYFLLQQNIFSLTWLACTRRRPSRWWRPGWGGSRCRCTRCRRPRTISSPATPTVPGAPPTVSI